MPQRIQRKRTKGWRMPDGAVYVGRPSRWGNPYSVEEYGAEVSLALFRNTMRGVWDPGLLNHVSDGECSAAYRIHEDWRSGHGHHPWASARAELAGKDLACWCPLDQPCHADVLLEAANDPGVIHGVAVPR